MYIRLLALLSYTVLLYDCYYFDSLTLFFVSFCISSPSSSISSNIVDYFIMSSTRLYVGNLSDRIKSRDLEDVFYKVQLFTSRLNAIETQTHVSHLNSTAGLRTLTLKLPTAVPATVLLNLKTAVMLKTPFVGEMVSIGDHYLLSPSSQSRLP